jgi:hypothetical protein
MPVRFVLTASVIKHTTIYEKGRKLVGTEYGIM